MSRKLFRVSAFSSLALAFAAPSCGNDRDDVSGPDLRVGTYAAGLVRATSCDDLLARIKADSIAKLDSIVEAALDPQTGMMTRGSGGMLSMGGTTSTAMDSAGLAPVANGGTSGGTSASAPSVGGDTKAAPSGYSDTNVQVAGVDEADIVKTDGQHLYVLHGSALFVLDAWPATSTNIRFQAPIDGDAREFFVQGNTAVVFSTIYDSGALVNAGRSADQPPLQINPTFTKLTAIDVSGAAPQVLREYFVEGDYLSARRHDQLVRMVAQNGYKAPNFYPQVQYYDAWGQPYEEPELRAQLDEWKSRMVSDIQATTIEQWLPMERAVEGGQLVALAPRCTDYYAPSPGLTENGVTSIVTVDLSNLAGRPGGATILGGASEIYANASTLVLAQRDWRWSNWGIDASQTVLHRFELDAADTRYTASGFVPGFLHNQFSIDEAGGILRVATTQQTVTETTQPGSTLPVRMAGGNINRVVTLEAKDGGLVQVGSTDPFGAGEQVFSARFVGDHAYVVTYRQTDPLFVVDLADAKAPKVLGSVAISGFSDYMHPLDATHLLTIGRETQVTPEGWTQDIGLQLQIFDVSDPMAPTRTQQFVYTRPGYSAANNEHKAFTYYADKGLLAFPFVSYDANFSSSLEVFHVDVDAGFRQLGSIEHGQLIANECLTMSGMTADMAAAQPYYYYSCIPSPEVRRGTFIDNFVYSVSYGGVLVHSLDNLTQPVATVPLPPPTYSSGSYGKDIGMSSGVGGAVTGGGSGGTAIWSGTGGAVGGGGSGGSATSLPLDAGVAVSTSDGGGAMAPSTDGGL